MPEESIVVFLRAQIAEFTGKMGEASAKADEFGKKGGSTFGKFQQISTGALLAVGAAAVTVGAYGVKMADEYEKAHARLETAVKNSGGNFEELKGKVSATDKAMESLGFTNADTESSIATLTGATHDASKAMQLQGLAADIARGRHIDLATATGILVKVETGHVGQLGKLGINTKDVNGKTIDTITAVKRLTDLYGGNAKAYTETFAGKIEVLKTKGEDLAKNIGMMLIPVIEQLVSTGLNVVTWLQNANDATGGWIAKIALFSAGGVLAFAAISKIVAGTQMLITYGAQAVSFIARMGVEMVGFVAYNPELAALVATAGLGVLAFERWGAGVNYAKIQVDELTNAQLVEYLTKTKDKLDEVNASPFAPHVRDNEAATVGFAQALQQGIPQAQRWIDAMQQAGLNTDTERKALQNRITAQKENEAQQKKMTGAVDDGTTSLGKEAAQAQQAAQKIQQLVTSMLALNDANLAADGSNIATQQSILNVASAQQTLQDKLVAISKAKKGDVTASNDYESAQLSLRQSVLSVIQSAEKQAIDTDKVAAAQGHAKSATQQAKDVTDTEKVALGQLGAQVPGLTGIIAEYERQLGLIPPAINTQITVNGVISSGGVGVITRPRAHAAGGKIGPGEWGTVGEQGWELAQGLPGGGVQIYPHTQSKALVGAGVRSGGGSVVHHVELTVNSLDPRAAGPLVVGALKDHRRVNGKFPWE